MSRAPISFVIPAYNDAPGVARHFDYFFNVGHAAELIVVDDASGDGLEDLVRNAEPPAHVSLRYHRNRENLGPGPSRNAGLELATCAQVMFLDADDLLTAEFFDYIALSPLKDGADFVLFKHHLCRRADEPFSYYMHPVDNRFFCNLGPGAAPDRRYTLAELPSALRIVNFPWNKVYQRDFLERTGIRFPDIRIHEDIRPHWQSCLRARSFGVLHWAPPLLHHNELQDGTRQTDFAGAARAVAFEELAALLDEIAATGQGARLVPELLKFADDLMAWMSSQAPDHQDNFEAAVEALYARASARPGDSPASEPGQVFSLEPESALSPTSAS